MNTWLFRLINDGIKNPFFDWLLPIFSDKDYLVIPGIMALAFWAYVGGKRARFFVVCLLISLAIADIGSEKVIKNIVRLDRPYATLEGVHLHRGEEWRDYDPAFYPFDTRKSYSFPSSHAANMAAVAAVLAFLRLGTLWVTVPLALLVGLSRIYTGNHYPLDILGGYIWGGLVGMGVTASFLEARRFLLPAASNQEPSTQVPPERQWFYVLLATWLIGNFLFLHLNLFDLAGDEAQYWDWSRRLALGYYSKPPLVAYVIRALTNAGGNKEWAIRSGALLFSAASLVAIHALALRMTRSERAAFLAAATAVAMPATWAGSVLMTIDPMLVFFWAVAAYFFYQSVREGRLGSWILTGLAIGLGMLAKYTMALIFVSFFVYLLVYDRRWLLRKEPWVAALLALLCLSGVLYWNWANDWVSFRHTAQIGASEEYTLWTPVRNLLELAGGQIGVVSPLILALFVWAGIHCLLRAPQNPHAGYLALISGVPLVFYGVVAVARRPEANWPVAGYVGACVAVAWAWQLTEKRPPWERYFLTASLILGCLIGASARATDLLYLFGTEPAPGARQDRLYLGTWAIDPDVDPTNRLRGARELGNALGKYVGDKKTGPFLFSDRYQVTAWMAFYTPGRPKTYCLPLHRRQNQYDLWGGWKELAGRDGIFVTGGDTTRAQRWVEILLSRGLFERGEVLETVEVWRGKTLIKTFTISRLYHYSGEELKPLEIY
ncbi:MAG TPA: glycosyltransferase family 39 protein [Candidatus Hydrogenedentes bacterium]|nr:glycosyltransferase family 39 protein [Candidatus Hydrogenedentota bacterium]HOL78332.1 glycosyltransferase family 39 protein [Candidatus Hydrogenedentota bacterium]HPO86307.1 glycosyltransferase family 39 protein [Candidatus Hydrogenedentota bacterium]